MRLAHIRFRYICDLWLQVAALHSGANGAGLGGFRRSHIRVEKYPAQRAKTNRSAKFPGGTMDARSDLCKEQRNALGAAGHADKFVATRIDGMAARFKDQTA